ncbi:hypothetical protein L3X38_044894 [Prunus dulcis]|uniref:Uncharacterized protein n=1 Tax=Prunus dulcis TaxID=3755 RepID=A0AAD4V0L7_PRUDU|nr:hypothetical protein L3X38_044894 [Prunus dulcis]
MENPEEKGPAYGGQDFTQDGTVDLKGRPILRSKTGRWRACSFIVGYEIFERWQIIGFQQTYFHLSHGHVTFNTSCISASFEATSL